MIEHIGDTTGYLTKTEGMVANRTRFKIFQAVAAIHILAIGGPFVWHVVLGMFKPPPPKIMTVRMITQLPETYSDHSSSAPGGYASPGDGVPAPPAVVPSTPSVAPRQPTINPVALKPPPLTPVQPRVAPAPPPVRVASRTAVKKPPVKPVKKPETPAVTQAGKKQAGKPDKNFTSISPQEWQKMQQSNSSATGSGTPTPTTAPAGTTTGVGTGTGRGGGPVGPPGDGLPGDKFALDFSQYVAHYLKENWDTPSRIQLGGREPEVTIKLHFAPSGQIVSWEMVKPSGIAIMDTSVEKLMRFARKIPQPPPKNVTELTLILAISD